MGSDAIELGFRHDLARLAQSGRLQEFLSVRLVFADWLAEYRPEEEAITRAAWQRVDVRKHKDQSIEFWHVPLPYPDLVRKLPRLRMLSSGCLNSTPILCFAPLTLRLSRFTENHTIATFTVLNDRMGCRWLDIGAHRLGYRALFHPNPGSF